MTAGFLELILSDLNSVDLKIQKALKIKPGLLSKYAHLDTELLQQYLHPSLVLFSGRLYGYSGSKIIHLATAIQFINLAARIHFRVPDDSERGLKSEDLRDGAQLPVLVGDYLYGKYFVGLCEGDILQFLSPLAQIIAEMNYGALQRRKITGRALADTEQLMGIIEKETALLAEGATKLAGVLAGASEVDIARLARFGFNTGMAYGILERGLDPAMAISYFDEARKALNGLPEGEAREALWAMLGQIQDGELVVPMRAIGDSRTSTQRQIGDMVIPEQYRDKEEYVHLIFSSIAKKYDTLNTVLSFNRDKHWRKFTVEQTGLRPGGCALDVCCGTGMLTVELARKAGPDGTVTGLDFCEEMLEVARDNLKDSPYLKNIKYIQGNAMELPFPDNSFDCVTIAFGLRNVPDMNRTIRELARVIRPGGRVVCLEFSKPTVPVFKQVYNFYFDKWVPLLGRLGVGIDGPYRYLHNSWKVFPHQKELCHEFAREGLQDVCYHELTGGIVSVHTGVKPGESRQGETLNRDTVIQNVAAAKE